MDAKKELNLLGKSPEEQANELVEKVIVRFTDQHIFRDLSPPLAQGEEPEEFELEPSLHLSPHFFEGDNALPPMLERAEEESLGEHEDRVFKFMLACDDDRFSSFGSLPDMDNRKERKFADLYNQALMQRLKQKEKNKRRCVIF